MEKAWLNVSRGEQPQMSCKDWKQTTPEGRRQMKERYKFIMKEVNDAVDCFISAHEDKPLQFLDVCCCPGGFSEYVLVTAPRARGVGLSLPVELGGHIPSFETIDHHGRALQCPLKDPNRYHLHFVDVTTVAGRLVCGRMHHAGGRSLAPEACIQTFPHAVMADKAVDKSNCQLIILDGSFLGGKNNIYMETAYKNDRENPAFNCYDSHVAAHQALLAAQLAIMTQNAAAGATIVIRMSMTWSHFTNGVLALLRRIFKGSIQGYKPRSCHQTAISYYLVCTNYTPAIAHQLQIGERFRDLVKHLRNGGKALELVPFAELPEGSSRSALYRMWGLALQVYRTPLWLFRKLSHDADAQPVVYGQRYCFRPCWRNLVFRDTQAGCSGGDGPGGLCTHGAHHQHELHPFTVIAFNQINSQLFMPRIDGTLLPGQGHARREEDAVVHKLGQWCKAQLLRSMGVSECDLNPLQHVQFETQVIITMLNMQQQVWAHILQICAFQEQQLFYGDSQDVVPRYGPGGIMLKSVNLMANDAQFSAARILKGPVPGANPRGSAMDDPLDDPLIGYKEQYPSVKGVAGMFGRGRGRERNGSGRKGAAQGKDACIMDGDAQQVQGVGVTGVSGHIDRKGHGGMEVGSVGLDQESLRDEEHVEGDQSISGYAVTFIELRLPQDDGGYSLQTMMQYL